MLCDGEYHTRAVRDSLALYFSGHISRLYFRKSGCAMSPAMVFIALGEDDIFTPPFPPLHLSIVLCQGLDALEKYRSGGPSERVINALFGLETLSVPKSATDAIPSDTLSAAMARLNDSQREAVAFALSTRDVALIHGPPGESMLLLCPPPASYRFGDGV